MHLTPTAAANALKAADPYEFSDPARFAWVVKTLKEAANPPLSEADKRITHEYAGFKIRYSVSGAAHVRPGWIVSKGGTNPMPGATFALTLAGAYQLINVYMATAIGVDETQRFWHLLRAIQAGKTE